MATIIVQLQANTMPLTFLPLIENKCFDNNSRTHYFGTTYYWEVGRLGEKYFIF
jgi:hypothetical protein